MIRAALPGVPWAFMVRDPAAVVASLLREPGLHTVPGMAPAELFGLELDVQAALAAAAFDAKHPGQFFSPSPRPGPEAQAAAARWVTPWS